MSLARIHTRDVLLRKTILTVAEAVCPCCPAALETANHLIFGFPFAVQFWQCLGVSTEGRTVESIHCLDASPAVGGRRPLPSSCTASSSNPPSSSSPCCRQEPASRSRIRQVPDPLDLQGAMDDLPASLPKGPGPPPPATSPPRRPSDPPFCSIPPLAGIPVSPPLTASLPLSFATSLNER